MDWLDWIRIAALLVIFLAAVLYFLRPKRFGTNPIDQPDNWQNHTPGPD